VRNDDLTVVYYSASTEDPVFEAKVRAQILAAGGGALPIISVTQKPVNFGRNICVGEVGCCDANAFRQLQIGALQVDSGWIAVAEADALYPPAYFQWHPDAATPPCVRYSPIYILWNRPQGSREGYWQKEWTEGAQYVRTDYLLKRLDLALSGRPTWSSPADPHPRELMRKRRWGYRTEAASPVISCKTGRGLRWRTGVIRHQASLSELPYWGPAEALRDRFFVGEIEEATV
jgi:hypothetical protein